MEKLSLQQLAELQLKETTDKLKDISNELEVDISDLETEHLLGGPLDNIQRAIDGGMYVVNKYNEIVNKGGILGEGKQVVIDEINKMKGVFKTRKDGNGPNPPSPGRPSSYDYSGGERATNIQAAGAKPIDVKFETDIKVRTYGDIDLSSDTNIQKTPIVLSRQVLDFSSLYRQVIDDKSGKLVYDRKAIMAQYVQSVLNKLNNIAQSRVSFATSFTYSEIATWLSTLSNALNAYYGIYSIVQFEQDFRNKNEGMMAIRRNITADDWNQIDVFVMDLMGSPMPPNLAKLFYMLNGNYRFEELPKAPILKFTSADIQNNVLNFGIPKLIEDLNDPGFRETCRKIIRAVPNWFGNDLPMYGPETYHSRNFNTIFANSGHVIRITPPGETSLYCYHPSLNCSEANFDTKEVHYVSNANDLDGLTTALYCCWDSSQAQTSAEDLKSWITGLFKPQTFTQFHNNRAVFYDRKLVVLDSSKNHNIPFVHEIDSNGHAKSLGFGVYFEQIYGLSVNSLRETSKELVDWMFDLGSIPPKDAKSTNKKGTTKSKRSRGKSRKNKKSIGKEEVKETQAEE